MDSPGGRIRADGSLPAAGRLRLDRLNAGQAQRTSYLTAASAAGLRSVGFHPVGDVLGCATSQIAYAYVPGCTSRPWDRAGGGPATAGGVRTGAATPGGGSGYLGLVRGMYAKALRRLTDEAVAMGADGVVGISLTATERDGVTEIVALGTGVRSGARPRIARPFTTDLPATDVAKLLGDGWVPVSLHVAAQLGVRHLDLTSARFMRTTSSRWVNTVAWAGANAEVAGPSELIQQVKVATRTVLARQAAAVGADGCLLRSLEVTVSEKACMGTPGDAGDIVGLGIAIGTSVARLPGAPRRTGPLLTVLPLTTRGEPR